MVEVKKSKNHWGIKENCRKESLKYKTRTEFNKGTIAAYKSSLKNGWMNEFFPKTEKGVG